MTRSAIGLGSGVVKNSSRESPAAADTFLAMSATRYGSGTGDFVRAFGNSLAKRFPDEINCPSLMPRKTDALLKAGFTESEVEKIMGANLVRVLGEIWGG